MVAAYDNETLGAEILLDHGANINAADKRGFTPLIISIHQKSIRMLELFLRRGASIDQPDRRGRFPMNFFPIVRRQEVLALFEAMDKNEGKLPVDYLVPHNIFYGHPQPYNKRRRL